MKLEVTGRSFVLQELVQLHQVVSIGLNIWRGLNSCRCVHFQADRITKFGIGIDATFATIA